MITKLPAPPSHPAMATRPRGDLCTLVPAEPELPVMQRNCVMKSILDRLFHGRLVTNDAVTNSDPREWSVCAEIRSS